MAKNKRIKYNRPINYPQTFTLRELYNANHHKVKYITLYSRVQKKIDKGEVAEVSLRDNGGNRRGRKEIVYSVVPAAPPVLTTEVAVPAAANW